MKRLFLLLEILLLLSLPLGMWLLHGPARTEAVRQWLRQQGIPIANTK